MADLPRTAAADRNLLFGILALQMDFLTRDQLIAALNAWVLEKHKPLAQILEEQGRLSSDDRALLESVVARHLQRHGDKAAQSLAALPVGGDLATGLHQLQDGELQASLSLVSRSSASDPRSTVDWPPPGDSGTRYRILRPHARRFGRSLCRARHGAQPRSGAQGDPGTPCRPGGTARSLPRGSGDYRRAGTSGHRAGLWAGHYQDGRPYYAMRFIRGDSLQEAIRQFHEAEKPGRASAELSLALRALLRRFVDVCNAVSYAHSRGVLHRDLKPGNIMLGKYGETLVVDWGLAKATDHAEVPSTETLGRLIPSCGSGVSPTLPGSAIGTPAYMSPEQAAGALDQLGPATDVYSLGAMLYHLLAGKPAIEPGDIGEVLQRVQRGTFLPPRHVKSEAPAALEAICLKAMALKPGDRYPTPQSLADDVEHWLADEPVTCHRERLVEQAGRWARRHKALTATAAAALVTATLGLALGLYFVNSEKNRTELARQGEAQQRSAAEAARAHEEEQRLAATASEAQRRAVLEFVENKVFAAARPETQEGGLGYQVTLRKAVEAALPFVESGFKDQPLVEARLRTTMGLSFLDLGEPAIAEKQFARARELYTSKLGPDHSNTLSSMNNLANSYADVGRTQDALNLREETLKLVKAKLGPDDPDTLASMTNLANSCDAIGRIQDALELREETLKLQKAKLGPDHRATLMSRNNLATSYGKLGRTQDALKLHEETFKLCLAQLGPDHPNTLNSMYNLAISYAAVGRTYDAVKLHEETLKMRQAKLGPDHPDTLVSMTGLANCYLDVGRSQDALKLHEETLRMRQAKLGPDHPDTLGSMNNLANSYTAVGRLRDALKLYEETLKLQKAKLGLDHPKTLMSMNNLAASYLNAGETEQGLALLHRALEGRQKRLAANSKNPGELATLAYTHGQIGQAEQARFDFKAAVASYRAAVEMFEKLDQAKELTNPFFRGQFNFYRQRLALCRKAERAANDLDFALAQPAAELGALLDLRVRFLLKEHKVQDAVQTADRMKDRAGKDASSLYDAACLYSLCAAVATAGEATKPGDQAMRLLEQAVANGFKDAGHMKGDADLKSLQARADFKKLVADLEKQAAPPPGKKP